MTNNTNHPFINNNDVSNVVQPGRLGKFNAEPLIDEKTAAIKLNRNAALLEAFAECLVYKSTTIYSLGDNAC